MNRNQNLDVPFDRLREDVNNFNCLLDANVEELFSFLRTKISNLYSDASDTISGKESKRLDIHAEVVKAKYNIFVDLTSKVEEIEQAWVDKLAEMRSTFLENVEILLAKTKLEVAVDKPSPRKGTRGSLSLLKRTLPAASPMKRPSSLYPAIPSLSNTMRSVAPIDVLDVPGMSNVVHVVRDSDESSSSVEEDESPRTSSTPVKSPFKKVTVQSAISSSGRKPRNVRLQVNQPKSSTRKMEDEIEQQDLFGSVDEVFEFTPTRALRNTKMSSMAESVETGRRFIRRSILNKSDSHDYPKTPKSVHFSVDMDVNEDLEVYSPEVSFAKSTPRRKTVLINLPPNVSEVHFTERASKVQDVEVTTEVSRGRPKRKTISGGVQELAVPPSPKRKRGRSSLVPTSSDMIIDEPADAVEADMSFSEDNFTPWLPLVNVDASVPTTPGIYELKSAQAKRPAFIGGCHSLRKQLTLHKMLQKCGNKHLDKFLERNIKHVQVRFEALASSEDILSEERSRIQKFVDMFKTTPAFN